jgi:hypothetical protein
LRRSISELTPPAKAPENAPAEDHPAAPDSAKVIEALRRSLLQNTRQLHALLSPQWQDYLALPSDLRQPGTPPKPETLARLLERFAKINDSPEYKQLSQRPEFQHTYEVLREYDKAVAADRPGLLLPPPPP